MLRFYPLALLALAMPLCAEPLLCEQQSVSYIRCFWKKKAERQTGGALGYPRDYPGGVTEAESQDIHYIVKVLADKSIVTIARKRYSLEAAGDRIDHVHPLNFLLTVFLDEELKIAMRNIRGNGWVWSNFIGGIKQTLTVESRINNVIPHIGNFAGRLEIESDLIMPAVRSYNWDHLVDLLIKHIPRKDDGNRYDF